MGDRTAGETCWRRRLHGRLCGVIAGSGRGEKAQLWHVGRLGPSHPAGETSQSAGSCVPLGVRSQGRRRSLRGQVYHWGSGRRGDVAACGVMCTTWGRVAGETSQPAGSLWELAGKSQWGRRTLRGRRIVVRSFTLGALRAVR